MRDFFFNAQCFTGLSMPIAVCYLFSAGRTQNVNYLNFINCRQNDHNGLCSTFSLPPSNLPQV